MLFIPKKSTYQLKIQFLIQGGPPLEKGYVYTKYQIFYFSTQNQEW